MCIFCLMRWPLSTLLWYESLCTFLGLELVSWHLYVRLGVPAHVGEVSFVPCCCFVARVWELDRGVLGCRSGPCPVFGCLCSGLRDFLRWSYPDVSCVGPIRMFHLFTCTMGSAPIKWTCTVVCLRRDQDILLTGPYWPQL